MTTTLPAYRSLLLLLLDYWRGVLLLEVAYLVYSGKLRFARWTGVERAVVGNRLLWCRVPISKSYKCYTELLSVVHAIRSWLEIKLYQALLGALLGEENSVIGQRQ